MVEFNDLFQEIRRAEKGDGKRASERYVADVASQPAAAPDVAPATPNDPAPLFQQPPADASAGAPRETDSALLDAALAISGQREPTASSQQANVADLDATGQPRYRAAIFPMAARVFGALFVTTACVLAFAIYVAAQNDWLLDLNRPSHMFEVAFQGATYEPRESVVIAPPRSENPVGEIVAGDEPENALAASADDGGVYVSERRQRYTVVDGTVTNHANSRYRRVFVNVALVASDGTRLASLEVPAGGRLEAPVLEEIAGPEELAERYAALAETASSLELEPGQQTVFSAVFPYDEAFEGAAFVATVERAERSAPSSWQTVVYSTDVVAPEGSGATP